MRLLAIADLHFDHYNIIKYCDRPFEGVAQMNDYMIDAWNRIVQPDDRVLVVGDFHFGPKQRLAEILSQLKGRKSLIIGNHDRRSKSVYLAHFDCVADRLDWNQFIFTHHPMREQIPDGKVNIHGHTHQYHQQCGREIKDITKRWDCDRVCVSVEAVNYEPVVIWKGRKQNE